MLLEARPILKATHAEQNMLASFFRDAKPPRLRSISEFAEQEIVLPPGGPHGDERFNLDRQPFARLLFQEIESGKWQRHATTALSQSGKTLLGYVIPGLYHLFEIGETVILGLPSMDMSRDKWEQDLKPVIEASRYRNLLPRTGAGSRGGGSIDSIKFRNGATLKFMSAGGNDKKRAGFTSRVLLMTEVDGFDTAGGTSREANPVDQMLARLNAHGDNFVVYMECTVSIERGRIWTTYTHGTASRIALMCPHCLSWVTPEREDLKGWADASDVIEAGKQAHIACPKCSASWTEHERHVANRNAKLLHRGQEIAGTGRNAGITGELPRTRTLGFRWTAVNNLLAPMSKYGEEEWEASRQIDKEDADRKMNQFIWVRPVAEKVQDIADLSLDGLMRRQSETPQGLVPTWADMVTVGVDCGQWALHWVCLAGDSARKRHVQVVDYGTIDVLSRQYPITDALSMALDSVADMCVITERGWPGENGEVHHADLVFYDAGWQSTTVYQHCRARGPRHQPTIGRGLGQYAGMRYHVPRTTGTTVRKIFDGYHLAKIRNAAVGAIQVYEFDADRSKSRVHNRLALPEDQAGALLLPHVEQPAAHAAMCRHLLSEHQIEEDGEMRYAKRPGFGGQNHWLDAAGIALLAMYRRWSALLKQDDPTSTGGGWYENQRRRG